MGDHQRPADGVTRRRFLTGAGGTLLALPLVGAARPGHAGRSPRPGPALPFGSVHARHGVRRSQPRRLRAVDPARARAAGGGGMPPDDVPVRWEVASDDASCVVVRAGHARRHPVGHSVHVDVASSARTAGTGTASAPATRPARSAAPAPPAPGRARSAALRVRLVPELAGRLLPAGNHTPGGPRPRGPPRRLHLRGRGQPRAVRQHDGAELTTLDGYRNRYALYRGDPACRAPRRLPVARHLGRPRGREQLRRAPPAGARRGPEFLERRAAAYQAWWSTCRCDCPTGRPRPRIYRSVAGAGWPVPRPRHPPVPQRPALRVDDIGDSCPDRTDPDRTMLGAEQEAWLDRGCARPGHVERRRQPDRADLDALAGTIFNLDQWDGYSAAGPRPRPVPAAGPTTRSWSPATSTPPGSAT